MKLEKISIGEFLLEAFDPPGLRVQVLSTCADNGSDLLFAVCLYNDLNSYFIFNRMIVADRKWFDDEFDDVFESIVLKGGVDARHIELTETGQVHISWPAGDILFSSAYMLDVSDRRDGLELRPRDARIFMVRHRATIHELISEMSFEGTGGQWTLRSSPGTADFLSLQERFA